MKSRNPSIIIWFSSSHLRLRILLHTTSFTFLLRSIIHAFHQSLYASFRFSFYTRRHQSACTISSTPFYTYSIYTAFLIYLKIFAYSKQIFPFHKFSFVIFAILWQRNSIHCIISNDTFNIQKVFYVILRDQFCIILPSARENTRYLKHYFINNCIVLSIKIPQKREKKYVIINYIRLNIFLTYITYSYILYNKSCSF